MSRSLNGNLIGAAARTNWQDIQERAEADRQAQAEKKLAQALDIAQEIRDTMTQEQYDAWWEAAPATRTFYDYTADTLLEIKGKPNYDAIISGTKKLTNEYRAQLHAEYNARFQGARS